MFRARSIATLMAAALGVAACGTDSSPTAPHDPGLAFRSEKSPAGGGAQVSHGDGQFFATFKEPGAPYFVAIGVSRSAAAEFCRGGDPDFGASKDLYAPTTSS